MKLHGNKTYLIVAAGLALVVMFYLRGDLAADDALLYGLNMLGLGAIRHGVG